MFVWFVTHALVSLHRVAASSKTALVALVVLICVVSLATHLSTPLGFDEASFVAGL